MFGNMWEKAMLKLVEVKEKDGAKKKLQVPFPLPHHPSQLYGTALRLALVLTLACVFLHKSVLSATEYAAQLCFRAMQSC